MLQGEPVDHPETGSCWFLLAPTSGNLWDCSHSGDQPWVQQQVVEAGFDDAFPPLPVLIRLVELLAQSLLIRVGGGQLEGPQGQTQLGAVTQTCRGTEGSGL